MSANRALKHGSFRRNRRTDSRYEGSPAAAPAASAASAASAAFAGFSAVRASRDAQLGTVHILGQ